LKKKNRLTTKISRLAEEKEVISVEETEEDPSSIECEVSVRKLVPTAPIPTTIFLKNNVNLYTLFSSFEFYVR